MDFVCKFCNDTGMIKDKDNNPILCECIKRKRLILLYKEVGLPLRFIDTDLDQYAIKQDAYGKDIAPNSEKKKIIAKNLISDFIECLPSIINGNPFVFKTNGNTFSSFTLTLSGGNNSGKSMLAACIIKGALRNQIRSYYLEWSEVINACFDYYSDASVRNNSKIKKYEKIMYIIEKIDLLVIDNLDSSYENNNEDRLTANVRRQIDAMFSARSKNSLPTIITTNQNFDELTSGNKYGPVLLSILEDSIKLELPTLGKSKNNIDMKKVN